MRGLLLVGVLVALAVPSIAEAEGTQPVKDNDTDKNADVSAEIHTLENLVVKETGTSVETLIEANDDAAPAERGELDPLKRDKRTVLLALAKGILVGKALGFALGAHYGAYGGGYGGYSGGYGGYGDYGGYGGHGGYGGQGYSGGGYGGSYSNSHSSSSSYGWGGGSSSYASSQAGSYGWGR